MDRSPSESPLRRSHRQNHRRSCVKLYLCSNPEDSVVERRALRENVFPKLREHCRHSRGLDLRVIDPFESSDPSRWPDENTRRQLIEECRESSAGPFLLALIGHQYGKANLPTQVEVSEYQVLLQGSQQAGVSTQGLQRAYQRDENIIPPSFCLTPPSRYTCPQQAEDEEDVLRKVFQATVSLCVHKGLVTPERAQSFCTSALDADLRCALENHPDNDITGRCLVYIHKVINAEGEREKRTMNCQRQPPPETASFDLRTKPTDGKLHSDLCDNFLPGLITSTQLLVYTTATECDHRHGYTTARRRGYARSLCQQVYADLVGLIDSMNILETNDGSQLCDVLAMEQEEQEELCDILSRCYEIIRPEEEKVRAYVQRGEQQRPLVVVGGPCTGKAVLLAHCAQQIKSWLPDCDPVVLTYFCNLSINPSPKHLLLSLCYHISVRYGSLSAQNLSDREDPSRRDNNSNCSSSSNPDHHPEPTTRDRVSDYSQDLSLDRQRLSSLLSLMPSTRHPLVLIFDGLDHMENNFGPQIIGSLPSPLPPNVKVLLTVSSKRTQVLQAVNPQSPASGMSEDSEWTGCVCLPLGVADRKQCVKMSESLLSRSGRRVTSGQQALVNQALTSCRLPLYARLLQLHTSLWRSDSDVTERSLPDGVHSSISLLLDHLEHKHGSSIVARGLSYLALSRTGLTEAELADLLSSDDQVLNEYVPQAESASSRMRVPQIDVETLLLDLRRFLIRRTVAGLKVLFWVSRHFRLVVAKRYLGTQDARKDIHSAMADYFSGQWAGGTVKPLLVKQTSSPNMETAHMTLYMDRQPSSQPFVFSSSSEDVGRVNWRKVLELPHHLQESKKWAELEEGLLLSLGFHQAMVRAGLLGDLVAMLKGEEGSSLLRFSRESLLIASVLKSCACFLQSSPLQLPTVMETSLLPYLDLFPALEGYVQEIRGERRKRGGGLGGVLCPAPSSVPSIHCSQRDATCGGASVTEVAATDCGMVAEILDDGTAWLWKGCGRDAVRLSLSGEHSEMKFTGVKSSGRGFLLSTRCHRLLWWDGTDPQMFLQLKALLKTSSEPESNQQTPNRMVGFVACQRKFFLWCKEERFVSMFEVSGETGTRLRCHGCVTSVVCSSDASHLYCGQEEGTVSIFDTNTLCLLSTCSNSTHSSVTWMSVCEERWEMACVDRTGNVTLWDVTVQTQPPRFIKEVLTADQSNHILNTDHCEESNSLLVCHRHQVTLWDTRDWELWDRLLSPRGRSFTHAVLSHDGHLFLALLDTCPDTCPLVLVWRVGTGECVLSLHTNQHPHTLLKTSWGVIGVARDGCLTVWDSEMIDAAGAAPKMRCGVKEVLVEGRGACFYTSDGSEMVWRWSLEAGLPRANLLHEGAVRKLRLSPDNLYLVTLSAEDIYVWRTDTGQNILRMSGSRASDVLITPNNNFGVSISEQRLSRVWKLSHGGMVCSIHLHLSDAQVSPESTFLIGRRCGDLLAASLWSGSIDKRFSCVASSEHVVAFQTLSKQPDFVVVMAASGAVYTWRVAEETVCQQFQLPYMFHCRPQDFQMSCDGSYALLSAAGEAVHLLDLSRLTLCSFNTEGPVVTACLDDSGRYAAYVSGPTPREEGCDCSLHARPLLTVVRLTDGQRVGRVCLPKHPSTLLVCQGQRVFVGFGDGSVGVYSMSDDLINREESDPGSGRLKQCPLDGAPVTWWPRASPNVTWPQDEEAAIGRC